MEGIRIREFEPGDEAAFRRLNEEWIVRHFRLEPRDEYAFANPRETILDPGGQIFFAVRGSEILGCCALVPLTPGEYEIAKMAVTASAQGRGIGRLVLQATIEAGRSAGATRLCLGTNHALTPAIHLYRSLGFQQLPPECIPHTEYQRANVFMELFLDRGRSAKHHNDGSSD